jgi:16S rRNA (cytidine1402-2'-O)-methyltransferase
MENERPNAQPPSFVIGHLSLVMRTLFLVATPIGNLEDITARALRVLKEASLIAAEDTRTAHQLLAHFQIATPVTSYYEHNKLNKLDAILAALERGDVAVISEAGMPGLSDPGYELVRGAIKRGIRVVPIPGASALTAALVASGLPTDQFVYLGFLPRQSAARRKLWAAHANETRTLVAFEAPHRVLASLADLELALGNRSVCVAREITKMHEEFFRGTVSEARARFIAQAPRGEFVVVVEGAKEHGNAKEREMWSEARVRKEMARRMKEGLSRTDAAKQVARASGRDRREVYRLSM